MGEALQPFVPEIPALFEQRGAAEMPHPGGTLLGHLQRTARRLASWGADPALVMAGLCHAAYGTQGYPAPLLRLAERAWLRSEIGDHAESIVYAYCAHDRAVAFGERELRDRFSGEYWVPSVRMRRQLAELTAANELDLAEHGGGSGAQLSAVSEQIANCGAYLSQPARAAWRAPAHARDLPLSQSVPDDDDEIAYRDLGAQGECVVLWHGGATPERTWARQHGLSRSLRLRIPWRRGFAPSVCAPCQDWQADARDLLRVMPGRAHVVGHSYGAVSALHAAAYAPERFASLTLIEPPLWSIAPGDAELQQLAALGRAFLSGAPEVRAAFLHAAGLPDGHAETSRTERLARGARDPGEAAPPLDALCDSRLPIAIVSGAHYRGIETLCDALGRRLNAQRWRLAGAGHAVQRHAEFNPRLSALIAEASGG